MPTPESQRICFLVSFSMSLFKNSSSFFASSEPDFHSIPMYTSSVFSRKMHTFIFSGARAGQNERIHLPGEYGRRVHRDRMDIGFARSEETARGFEEREG